MTIYKNYNFFYKKKVLINSFNDEKQFYNSKKCISNLISTHFNDIIDIEKKNYLLINEEKKNKQIN